MQGRQSRKYSPSLPADDRTGPRHRKKRRGPAIAIAAIAAIAAGGIAYAVIPGGSPSPADSASAQASAALRQAVSRLAQLGFGGSDKLTGSSARPAADCVKNSAGDVRQFLAKNPCQEYLVTSIKATKQGISTQAAVTWVALANSGLAAKYNDLTDDSDTGLCYASGQSGTVAWVASVGPTGHVTVDREILQAVAPVKLSASYLAINCLN